MPAAIIAGMSVKRSIAKRQSRTAKSKKPVRQVAALPWRIRNGTIEVLLVTSRTTGRWVVPKGGVMAHLVDMNAARQEAFEEAGIEGRMQRRRIGTYTYRKIEPGAPAQLCAVQVFAMEVRRELRSWPEMHQRERRWFIIDEAVQMIAERRLRKVVRAYAKAHLSAKAG
jgi:8-oxo-dGTP pyrophosphatase MutT (NUDIX family)